MLPRRIGLKLPNHFVNPTHMKLIRSVCSPLLLATLLPCAPAMGAQTSATISLAGLKSPADLEAVIATIADPAKKNAVRAHSTAILSAAARQPHVNAVTAALDQAPGTYVKTNLTPAALKQALGGESAIFDTLKVVNLGSATLGIKAKREIDPFNQAFYEHLGHVADLEFLTIINTTAENAWLVPLANLHALTNLTIINQSKLNDIGLAHLAGLKQLQRFAYIGTAMTGKPFKDFQGWTKLKSSSFRGSQIDDEGLAYLCERFPNYETLSLAHAKFTDAGAVHLAKLKNLKGLELGSTKATSAALRNLLGLPLEYFQLGEGVDAPESIAIIRELKTLKRLTLTNCKTLTDAELQTLASMKHLEHLELGSLPLPPERLSALKQFAFLKSMRLVPPYPAELQTRIKEVLPNVAIKFD